MPESSLMGWAEPYMSWPIVGTILEPAVAWGQPMNELTKMSYKHFHNFSNSINDIFIVFQ